MPRLTLDLPQDLQSKLQVRAAETGHETVEGYVQALLRSDADASAAAEVDDNLGAPAHLTVDSQEQLEAKLLEGLDSGPATEMTAGDWDDIRQEVAARIAARRTQGE
jgi:antitoxin ParD1/3/4